MSSNRPADHLANERTFLAWVRTSIAVVVFGFAIGRLAVTPSTGFPVWFGTGAILAGVALSVAGWVRCRQTRRRLDAGHFVPAGAMIDFAVVLTALFGIMLAFYLVHVAFPL